MAETIRARRTIKDSVFTDLFGQPEYLLQLYQALHPEDTDVTAEKLKLVTLQNVMTDDLYNDLGFLVGDRLIMLVEAQSTWSVNIVIRAMLYLAQSYKEYLNDQEANLYGTKKADLPKPELYVIYTGERKERPETLSLSEEFFGGEKCALEVTVRMLYGANTADIVGQYVRFCKVLNRQIREKGYTGEAIAETIRICREEQVLTEYLAQHEKEVTDIMITLFDDEHIQKMYEKEVWKDGRGVGRVEGREEGREEGRVEGREEGFLESARSTAALMHADSVPLAVISKYVKYPIEVIAGWLGIQPT